jgi:hypothetical protein
MEYTLKREDLSLMIAQLYRIEELADGKSLKLTPDNAPGTVYTVKRTCKSHYYITQIGPEGVKQSHYGGIKAVNDRLLYDRSDNLFGWDKKCAQ